MLINKQVNEMLGEISQMFIDKEEELSKYDAVIGDGDHGITMARGAKAAWGKVQLMEGENISEQFKVYGRTMIAELGGAIGPLFGTIFLELGKATKGAETFDANGMTKGITNAKEKIMKLGGAKVGDKTMVDSIVPTSEVLLNSTENNLNFLNVLENAEEAALKGLESTTPLRANKGRSKYLEERAIGHQDAGATSFYYMVKTINNYVKAVV